MKRKKERQNTKTRYRYDVHSRTNLSVDPYNVILLQFNGGKVKGKERGEKGSLFGILTTMKTLALIHINSEPCFMLFMALSSTPYYSTNLFIDIKMKP